MTAYTIDTLATARKLQEAGFESNQAEAVAQAIAHSGQELATKSDIAGLRWMFGIQFVLTLLILARVFDFIGAPGQ